MAWVDPGVQVLWGDYYRQDPAEQTKTVELVTAAYNAGHIDRRTAVEKLAPIFDIVDVGSYLEQLAADTEERQKAAQESTAQNANESPDDESDDEAET